VIKSPTMTAQSQLRMDRMAGYGLNLPSSFKATHLGRIGRSH
jgi:Domain of unknown function (DUF4260)